LLIRLDKRGGIRFWLLSLPEADLGGSGSFCDGVVDTGDASLDDGLDDGGCGKAPMLIVFRSFLPGMGMLLVGRLDVDTCCFFEDPTGPGDRVGSAEETLRAVANGAGWREALDPRPEVEGVAGELVDVCRDLGTGSDGRGDVGGPKDGREGRGSVVAMMKCGTGCNTPHGCSVAGLYGVCCALGGFVLSLNRSTGVGP
jgi:hypothetical protein